MKAQLILLDNPIIVTDEEIKDGDWYFYGNRFDIKELNQFKKGIDDTAFLKEQGIFKIISTNKPIDYNGIDFGIVDVEKLAEEKYPTEMVSVFTQTSLVDKNKERRNIFIEGFKASQQLNEKKFSEAEVEKALSMAFLACQDGYDITTKEIISSLSLPKTFEVEIEETPNNIKIIKKL